jgi:hypothetical protein
MEIAEIEKRLNIKFPELHLAVMVNSKDTIHEACDFLVPVTEYELLDILAVNELLHNPDYPNPWPDFLVAFASNGCGDYFAYDLRVQPNSIIYIDPDLTVEENLVAEDKLKFETFDAWYKYKPDEGECF